MKYILICAHCGTGYWPDEFENAKDHETSGCDRSNLLEPAYIIKEVD